MFKKAAKPVINMKDNALPCMCNVLGNKKPIVNKAAIIRYTLKTVIVSLVIY